MTATEPDSHWRRVAAVLLAATAIGIVTGLVVLALEHLVDDVLHEVFEADVWVRAVVVFAGAVVTAVVIRYLGGRKTESTEVYVEQFHHAGYAVPLAGVIFVVEYTGQTTVIVPALIAMAVTRLVVGNRSVIPAQRP